MTPCAPILSALDHIPRRIRRAVLDTLPCDPSQDIGPFRAATTDHPEDFDIVLALRGHVIHPDGRARPLTFLGSRFLNKRFRLASGIRFLLERRAMEILA